ncbi:unnamed protein product [Bemisia tabaci]|uniref:Uncharacterized protein n=1 Tax=Bemisia tabaci TaxID=7038 RepID=A0A9P0AE07_BEMTA|nr:unnamed protein product [Bemisia tabaci]
MAFKVWLFLLAMTLPDLTHAIINNETTSAIKSEIESLSNSQVSDARIIAAPVNIVGRADHCTARLESALGSISSKRSVSNGSGLSSGGGGSGPLLDLSGYALHQPLRSAPLEMYVTDMKVKMPSKSSWASIEKCRYDPHVHMLQTQLLFHDLIITGAVKLYDESSVLRKPSLADKCNMTLRLRHAGLGFTATPKRSGFGTDVKTSTTFVDPNFVSIHAYNCQPMELGGIQRIGEETDGPEGREDISPNVSQEMEEVFLRGIRSLLTKYMEKKLHPALKDTLMINMGYTVSYGRR